MVYVAVGQDNAGDGAMTCSGFWMELGGVECLLAEVGRGVKQVPGFAVRTDGQGRLGLRRGVYIVVPRASAATMVAVPLGEASTGGGAQDKNPQHPVLFNFSANQISRSAAAF